MDLFPISYNDTSAPVIMAYRLDTGPVDILATPCPICARVHLTTSIPSIAKTWLPCTDIPVVLVEAPMASRWWRLVRMTRRGCT
jgi:hypothetical protein